MRITRIDITNLFNKFDYTINLNLTDENITIIHGPNGSGKTVLLSLIYGLFNSEYTKFFNTPFREFRIYFDNDSSIIINKLTNKGLEISLETIDGKSEAYRVKPIEMIERELDVSPSSIERYIPHLKRVGARLWFNTLNGEELDLSDVLNGFSEYLPPEVRRSNQPKPDWLEEIIKQIQVIFIKIDRLSNLVPSGKQKYSRFTSDEPILVRGVNEYSRGLAKKIEEILIDYAQESQELDRTFPTRLIDEINDIDVKTIDELNHELASLDDKRERLINAGLLSKDQDINISQSINDKARNILSVYIRDIKTKLSLFDSFLHQVETFKQIINKRLLFKEMFVSKERGFYFKTDEGKDLPLSVLSSGEQHEIALFYRLLFETPKNSLVLIDEPEISLHIVWQQQFLSDLSEVTHQNNFSILIATHSPDIIGNRWHLTVDLGEKSHEFYAE